MSRKRSNVKWFSLINTGFFIGCICAVLLYMTSLDHSNMKILVSVILGVIIGFLVSIIMYLSEQLHKAVIHDQLTGLYNLNFLSECKYRVISQTDRQQTKMGIVIVDIYKLKDLIQKYGNKAGDAIIQYVGEGLTTTSRSTEFLFRIDGDEFLIFFSDINEYSNIKVIRNRLENFFVNPLIYGDESINVALNFGYGVYPDDGDNFDAVMNVAKQRMYVEKSR